MSFASSTVSISHESAAGEFFLLAQFSLRNECESRGFGQEIAKKVVSFFLNVVGAKTFGI